MIIGKPAPFVHTFIDAVDQAMRQDYPASGLSAMQRSWLAFCVTATLVTHSMCWARFERARRLSEKASVEWPIVAVGQMKGENNASL